MGLAPASDLASSTAPFALVAGKMFGPWPFRWSPAAGMLKALGTLAGWVLMTAQVQPRRRRSRLAAADLRAHARRRYAGRGADRRWIGRVRSAILLTISPTLGQQFGLLSEASTMFALLIYLGALRGGAQVPGARASTSLAFDRRCVLHVRHRLVERAGARGHG